MAIKLANLFTCEKAAGPMEDVHTEMAEAKCSRQVVSSCSNQRNVLTDLLQPGPTVDREAPGRNRQDYAKSEEISLRLLTIMRTIDGGVYGKQFRTRQYLNRRNITPAQVRLIPTDLFSVVIIHIVIAALRSMITTGAMVMRTFSMVRSTRPTFRTTAH